MNSEYALGDKVIVARTLRRERHWNIDYRWTEKRWTAEPRWAHEPEPEPREGIIVGQRWLSNGKVEYLGYEEGSVFTQQESVMAYIVAFNLRRKHEYALPEHLTRAP